MATIVNTPATERSDSGSGFLLGIILLIVAFVLFFIYGVPYLTGAFQGPQVNVPGEIDVNVNQPAK